MAVEQDKGEKPQPAGKLEKTAFTWRDIAGIVFLGSAFIGVSFLAAVSAGAGLGLHAIGESSRSRRTEANKVAKDNQKKS